MEEESLNNSIPDPVIIKYLIRDNKLLLQELGKNQSYIDELEFNIKELKNRLNNFKASTKEEALKIRREEMYQNIIKARDSNKDKFNKLKIVRDQLLSKITKYESILKEHNLI